VKTANRLFCSVIAIVALSGCATFKTLETDIPLNQRMFVYSGTRLDWAAINKNNPALSKMKVEPPAYPLIDLPFSFALDSVFFPLSVMAVVLQ
jgi:uncharacterized protein YceK